MLSRELLDFPWDLRRDWDQERGAGLLSRLPREKTLLESFGRERPEELRRIRSSGPTFYLRFVFCVVLGGLSAWLVRSDPWMTVVGLIMTAWIGIATGRKWQRLFFQRAAESEYFRKRFDDLFRPQLNALRRLLQDADDFKRSFEGVEPFEYGKQHPEEFRPDAAQAIRDVHDDERNPIGNPDRRHYLARMVKEIAPQEFNQGHLSNEELEALMLNYYDAEYLALQGARTVPAPAPAPEPEAPPAEPAPLAERMRQRYRMHRDIVALKREILAEFERDTEHLPEQQRMLERRAHQRDIERITQELLKEEFADGRS